MDCRTTLYYINNGSYGLVLQDTTKLIYKITKLTYIKECTSEFLIERNNIIEVILLNMFNNICNNIISIKDTFFYKLDELNKIYDIHKYRYKTNENYYIVNTFNKYTNIKNICTKENLKETILKFKSLIKDILLGISALHQNGFLHGDIKLDNVLLNIDTAIIIDLGGVKLIDNNTYYKSCTITNRCPEDLYYEYYNLSNYTSSIKSDIWSLGILFTEILLGYNPILKVYNNLKRKNDRDKDIDRGLINYYSLNNSIDVRSLFNEIYDKEDYLYNENDYNEMERIINVIEKMLIIKPQHRIESIEKIYEEIFEEQFNFNYKKSYKYEYEFIKNNNFYKFRNKLYSIILINCKKINNINIVPFIFDLLDRLFNLYLQNDVDIYTLSDSQIESINISTIFIALIILYNDSPNFIEYTDIFEIKYINFLILQENIVELIKDIEYDIYRPFYFFNLDKNQKNKLENICNNILVDNIIGVTPTYYNRELNN